MICEDLGLGADVDAPCRLVEQQHPRLGQEALGDHDLLLVAARERGDGRIGAGDPDGQVRGSSPRRPSAPCRRASQNRVEVAMQARQHHVVRHATAWAPGASDLRSSGTSTMPASMRSATLVDRNGAPVEPDLAGRLRPGAREHLHQLRAAGAHQPVEPQDLAGPDLEARRGPAGSRRRAAAASRPPRAAAPRPAWCSVRVNSDAGERPTICSMIQVDVDGARRPRVATMRPSRSTVTRSPMRSSSSSLCEM